MGGNFGKDIHPAWYGANEKYRNAVTSYKEERYKNMRGVFHVNKGTSVKGKKILLADDIYTTGATMESAAHELMRAGAEKVVGITIASGAL